MVTSGSKKNQHGDSYTAKCQIWGFRTAVHKQMADVAVAVSIIYNTVYPPNLNTKSVLLYTAQHTEWCLPAPVSFNF